jgi:hypothetical protein
MKLALLAVVWVAVSCASEGGGRGNHVNNARVPSSTAPQYFTYATLIGAVDILRPMTYMGPVANALVAARSLRDYGSKADFVALIDFLDPEDDEQEPFPGAATEGGGARRNLPEEGLLIEQGVHVVYCKAAMKRAHGEAKMGRFKAVRRRL